MHSYNRNFSTVYNILWDTHLTFCAQVIFICSMYTYEDLQTDDYVYPKWSIAVGWVLTGSSLVCIPLYMVYAFIVTPGSFQQVHFAATSYYIKCYAKRVSKPYHDT